MLLQDTDAFILHLYVSTNTHKEVFQAFANTQTDLVEERTISGGHEALLSRDGNELTLDWCHGHTTLSVLVNICVVHSKGGFYGI